MVNYVMMCTLGRVGCDVEVKFVTYYVMVVGIYLWFLLGCDETYSLSNACVLCDHGVDTKCGKQINLQMYRYQAFTQEYSKVSISTETMK